MLSCPISHLVSDHRLTVKRRQCFVKILHLPVVAANKASIDSTVSLKYVALVELLTASSSNIFNRWAVLGASAQDFDLEISPVLLYIVLSY